MITEFGHDGRGQLTESHSNAYPSWSTKEAVEIAVARINGQRVADILEAACRLLGYPATDSHRPRAVARTATLVTLALLVSQATWRRAVN